MKTFRQLREKWDRTVKNPYAKNETVDVFHNPNRREIQKLAKDFPAQNHVRVFLMDNGDMYAWGGGSMIHNDMLKNLKGVGKKYIPVNIHLIGNKVEARISPNIYITSHHNDTKDEVVDAVENHRQIIRLFSDIDVITKTYFYSK